MTEAQRIWSAKSDEALLEAAAELDQFTEEGQGVIRAELRRRGFEDPIDQARFVHGSAPAPSGEDGGAEPGVTSRDVGTPAPQCLRCDTRMRYAGEKRFQEGTRWGVMGEIGHLFERHEAFHVWVCPACGHVDLFIDLEGH